MSKIRSLFVLATCLVAVVLIPNAESRQIDRIVAIVNDDVITETELQNQLKRVRQELHARRAKIPPSSVLHRQVLERMVTDKIQLQIANQLGLQVSADAVNKAMQELATRNKLTLPELKNVLVQEGVSFSDFRENIESQLIIRQLVEREVVSRIAVTDEEIEGFLADQEKATGNVKEYNVSHILIRVPEFADNNTITKLRDKAQLVSEKIRGGMAFAQAAVSFSQAQNALEGGDLGWRTEGQLPALFVDVVRRMEVGQVSEVLRSSNGFHILKLTDTRGGSKVAVKQTKARHILIKSDEFLSPTEAIQRINRIRERIVAGEDFSVLAKDNSDDPVSSINGGDLGWLNPGETVQEFERAMYKLNVGEMSEPIRTPFGVHLIQVLDRRQQELNEEIGRSSALAQIRARKSDERYEEWLRRLRDESYVELRSERQ